MNVGFVSECLCVCVYVCVSVCHSRYATREHKYVRVLHAEREQWYDIVRSHLTDDEEIKDLLIHKKRLHFWHSL